MHTVAIIIAPASTNDDHQHSQTPDHNPDAAFLRCYMYTNWSCSYGSMFSLFSASAVSVRVFCCQFFPSLDTSGIRHGGARAIADLMNPIHSFCLFIQLHC